MKSPAEFRRKAEAAFRKANPDAVAVGLSLDWEFARKVTWADGSTGFSGIATAASPGFRTRKVIASWDDTYGLMVR